MSKTMRLGQVAAYLKIDPGTLNCWLNSGQIKFRKYEDGGHVYYDREEINKYLIDNFMRFCTRDYIAREDLLKQIILENTSGRIQWITGKDIARMLGVNANTVNNWRYAGKALLPYVKVGALIRYRLCDFRLFEKWNYPAIIFNSTGKLNAVQDGRAVESLLPGKRVFIKSPVEVEIPSSDGCNISKVRMLCYNTQVQEGVTLRLLINLDRTKFYSVQELEDELTSQYNKGIYQADILCEDAKKQGVKRIRIIDPMCYWNLCVGDGRPYVGTILVTITLYNEKGQEVYLKRYYCSDFEVLKAQKTTLPIVLVAIGLKNWSKEIGQSLNLCQQKDEDEDIL